MGLDDDVRRALASQRNAERAKEQKKADDVASQQQRIATAWATTAKELDKVSSEIANTCRNNRCPYDYQRWARRGWAFSLPGCGDAIFITPNGKWQRLQNSYLQIPDGPTVRVARKAKHEPRISKSLTSEQIVNAIRPQIVDKANGKKHGWGVWHPRMD